MAAVRMSRGARAGSIARAASRCWRITPIMLSAFFAWPRNAPLLAAISADSAYASPVIIAVMLAAYARATSLS